MVEFFSSILRALSTIGLGILTAMSTLIHPITQELPHLVDKPTPTPVIVEELRQLTREEQATMSGSFIKEFESLLSSGSGRRK